MSSHETAPGGELLFYQTEDGRTRLEVKLENDTVWLTQAQMSDLFQRERSVITKHIRNIFEEGELVEQAVCANYALTAADCDAIPGLCGISGADEKSHVHARLGEEAR